ncbi:DNA excision repair protein ERCC-8-like [Tropilaelaps mercedesae]|uniref:DNA excision repair protein ERCC-8-like n=1 Tax=Tropilaelaps mercedesae TaxID=418985 RepID=A0A1V9XSW1_9ACAR|nr:DNA excision repair protein ERCC-8-like [Tropilaelaps mercedesae]
MPSLDSRPNLIDDFRNGRVSAAAFKRIQTAGQIFDIRLSQRLDVERCHRSPVNTLSIDPVEGRYLLSAGASGQIFIHDTADVQMSASGQGGTMRVACWIDRSSRHCHAFSVETVQWYPLDTGVFASSGMDRNFKLWDTNRLKPVFVQKLEQRIYRHHLSSMNCQTVLLATENPYAQIMDLRSGSKIHQLAGAHRGALLTASWSPSCENICVTGGSDGKCVLWDVRYSRGHLVSLDVHSDRRGKGEHRKAHDGRIVSLEFTPDGHELVTFGQDNTVRLWDVALGKNRQINFGRVSCHALKGIKTCLTTESSPPMLVVPSEHLVKIFDLTSGLRLMALTGHFNSVNAVELCRFSRRLYTAGTDRNILLWTSSDGFADEEHRKPLRSSEPEGLKASANPRAVTEDNWSSDED